MSQELLPEVQQAIEKLSAAIQQAETEVVELAEKLKQKKSEIRRWKKAARAMGGQAPATRNKTSDAA